LAKVLQVLIGLAVCISPRRNAKSLITAWPKGFWASLKRELMSRQHSGQTEPTFRGIIALDQPLQRHATFSWGPSVLCDAA
jgi:hypothetical protein